MKQAASSLRLLLLCALSCSLVYISEAKTVIGLVDHLSFAHHQDDFARLVSNFCFTIKSDATGTIQSDLLLHDEGQNLLIVSAEDEKRIVSNSSLTRHPRSRTLNPDAAEAARSIISLFGFFSRRGAAAHWRRLLSVEDLPVTNKVKEVEPSPEKQATTQDKGVDTTSKREVGVPAAEGSVPKVVVDLSSSTTEGVSIRGAPPSETASAATVAAMPHPVEIRDEDQPVVGRATTYCEAFEEHARVTQHLLPLGERAKGVSSYNLILLVTPNVDRKPVGVMLTRCGSQPSAQYKLTLTNPGSFLTRHFSCFDQGILEILFLAVVCLAALAPALRRFWHKMRRISREQPAIDLYILACCAFGVFIVLYFVHVLTYAFDGWGIHVFMVSGDFAYVAFLCALTCTLASAVPYRGQGGYDIVSWLCDESDMPHYPDQDGSSVEQKVAPVVVLESGAFGFHRTASQMLPNWCRNLERMAAKTFADLADPSICVLASCAAAMLLVLFATMRPPGPADPLTPFWQLLRPRLDRSISGWLLFGLALTYYAMRITVAVRLLMPISLPFQQNLYELASLGWLVAVPLLALLPNMFWFISRHGPLIAILTLDFLMLIATGERLVSTYGEGLGLVSFEGLGAPRIGDVLKSRGRRGGSERTSLIKGSPQSSGIAPSFKTPAWEKLGQEDESEGEGEPQLVDFSAIHHPAGGSILGQPR